MVEFRLLLDHEYEQAIHLADKLFRDSGHVSMGEAFPQVFSSALHQSYGAFIDGELVSFIGLVPSLIHIGSAEVQAYSIGAVCTNPDYQKRGIASRLLELVFEHIQKAEASVLFVSGDLPLYIKAGCTYFGEVHKYDIHPGDLPVKDESSVRELQPYDWFQIRKLSQARKVRYEQSIYDLATLNQAAGLASISKMNHRILVAEANQEIKAFVVFTLPYHGPNEVDSRVIEWGGDPQAVLLLLAETFRSGIQSLRIHIPSYELILNQHLETLQKIVSPFPGTVKIINLNGLLKQLAPYLHGKVEIFDVNENHKKLIYKQKSLIVENTALEQLILTGNSELDADLHDIFPIPFPYPEGLNYV